MYVCMYVPSCFNAVHDQTVCAGDTYPRYDLILAILLVILNVRAEFLCKFASLKIYYLTLCSRLFVVVVVVFASFLR